MAIGVKKIKQLDAITTVPSNADLIININTGETKRASVEDFADSINTTFTGTLAEWTALTTAEKAKYLIVNLIDSSGGSGGGGGGGGGSINVVDVVENNNLSPVTSNAVYDYIDTVITQALTNSY